jgi:hypothetical protein
VLVVRVQECRRRSKPSLRPLCSNARRPNACARRRAACRAYLPASHEHERSGVVVCGVAGDGDGRGGARRSAAGPRVRPAAQDRRALPRARRQQRELFERARSLRGGGRWRREEPAEAVQGAVAPARRAAGGTAVAPAVLLRSGRCWTGKGAYP